MAARKKKTKKSAKKSSKKSSKKKSSKKPAKKKADEEKGRDPIMYLGLLLLLIIVVAVVMYMAQPPSEPGDVLATVNGEPITMSDLDFQYGLLPEPFKSQLSRDEVLEQMINEELVVQAAADEGIEVTDADVHARVQEIIAQGGMSLSDLQQNLDMFNVSMDEFESLIRKQITIDRYSAEHIDVGEPSEEELRSLYELRQDELQLPEQARVRHILISNQRDEAAVLARDLYDAARDGADFCVLVEENSDDQGSLQTCGEYTFPRGMMVTEFEDASFEMDVGEYRLVQTVFGYHIIEKLEHIEGGTMSFEDVREQLASDWRSAERARQYQIMLSDLRDDARITYGDEVLEVDMEEVEDDIEVVLEETSDLEQTSPESCIADRAVLYGTTWSTDTTEQRELFPEVTFVACDETPDACEGIEAYPSWVIGDKLVLGKLTPDELIAETGC